MNEELSHFLSYWFQGFAGGIEQMDDSARAVLLKSCGMACAQSYTIQIYREAWQASQNIQEFLKNLGQRFPEARYTLQDENTIDVVYSTCACDLVRNGWVKSLHLCSCSVANLQANFEAGLGYPVTVRMEKTLLQGGAECHFVVILNAKEK